MERKELSPTEAVKMMLDGKVLESKNGDENAAWEVKDGPNSDGQPHFFSWYTEKTDELHRSMVNLHLINIFFTGWYEKIEGGAK